MSPDSPFGAASLNLTNIRESDQGWYECKVVFLNRSPNQHKNGTWFHLDVHAPPRFSVTPEDIIYVNLGKWAPFVFTSHPNLIHISSINTRRLNYIKLPSRWHTNTRNLMVQGCESCGTIINSWHL